MLLFVIHNILLLADMVSMDVQKACGCKRCRAMLLGHREHWWLLPVWASVLSSWQYLVFVLPWLCFARLSYDEDITLVSFISTVCKCCIELLWKSLLLQTCSNSHRIITFGLIVESIWQDINFYFSALDE